MARPAREAWNAEAACLGAALSAGVKWWDGPEAPPEALSRLPALQPAYRCDRLLELGAVLHDVLAAYRAGRVGPTTMREAALEVAIEACLVYLCERPIAIAGELVDWGEWEEIDW